MRINGVWDFSFDVIRQCRIVFRGTPGGPRPIMKASNYGYFRFLLAHVINVDWIVLTTVNFEVLHNPSAVLIVSRGTMAPGGATVKATKREQHCRLSICLFWCLIVRRAGLSNHAWIWDTPHCIVSSQIRLRHCTQLNQGCSTCKVCIMCIHSLWVCSYKIQECMMRVILRTDPFWVEGRFVKLQIHCHFSLSFTFLT